MARNLFPFSSGKRSLIRVIRMQIPKAMQTTFVSRKTHLFRPSLTLFKTLGCVFAAWLIASGPGAARAATFGWSGNNTGPGSGAGSAWLTAGHWTNNLGTPTNTDLALFGAGGTATSIGFNFNVPPITSTNIGAIVLGAGSTVDRIIGNSSTTVGIQTRMYHHGLGGGLITNAVAGRTLTFNAFAGGSGNGMTNILLNSGVIEAVGNIAINTSIGEAGGARTITKTGNGTLTLGAQNTFSGKMIVNAGILAIGDENRLGNNPAASTADQLTLNGSILQLTAAVTIDDGNRGITLGASHGTFNNNGQTLTVSRPITGPGNLTNTGTGTVILNSANTYAGRTVLRGGITRLLSPSSTGPLPGGYVADQIIIDGGGLMNQDSEFLIEANRGITIGSGGARFQAGFSRPWGVNSIIAGSGTLTIANDATPAIISLNAANTFTNDLIINNTTGGNNAFAAINGSIAAGSVVRVTTNGWLLGNGTINRNVIATNGGVINPGNLFGAGTLTVNGALSVTNSTLSLDLAAFTTVGSDVNDLLQINGNVTLAGLVTVRPNALAGTLATGTYRLINYTGTLTGSAANLTADAPGYTITFDTSTAGQINMIVSGTAPTVTWTGLNGPLNSPVWDVAFTTNFTDGLNPTVFRQGQSVIFDNTGTYFSGGIPVSINMVGPSILYGALYPATVTIDTTNNFTLTSPAGSQGKISGAATVFKTGNGLLTLNTGNGNFPNDYTGPTIIEGGIVRPAYTRALGATNGPTIATNGGTLDVNAQSLGAEPFIISGAGVSNNGALVNLSGTGQNNALRYLTLAGDATVGGLGRWDVRNYAQNNNWPNAFVQGGGYSLIKTGANQVSFVDVGNVNLGKVTLQQGTFQFEGSSIITNAAQNIEIAPGSTLGFWGSRMFHTKPLAFNHNGRLFKDNGTTTNDGPVTLLGGTAILDVANNSGDIFQFRNEISGPGGLAKIGAGNLILSGTNIYSGVTVVSNGTLTLQTNASIANSSVIDVKGGATLNASTLVNPLTIGSGKMLTGAGTIVGRVTADTGANVAPGTSPGTLNVSSNLTFNNANLTFELNTAATEGSGVNDLINARDITLSGLNTLNIIPLTTLGAGPYNLMRYTNSLTGDGSNLSVGGGSRYTWTVDTSLANLIRITPAGAPASLTWAGGVLGSESLWDVNTTANWTNGAAPDNFFQGDAVSFTDFSTYTNISLVGSLTPGNITADHTFPITFGGAGQIKTLSQMAKLGTGTLIMANDNPELNGGITISAGTLQLGEGGTTGSVGPLAPITNLATLVFNRSDSNALPNVVRGSGGLIKNGAGVLALGGANAFSGPVMVNEGKIRIANAGALGSSNNNVTINNGAQIDFGGVAQGGAHQRYSYTIAGSGPDGRGAVVNNGNTVSTSSGLSNVTLTADAAIGTFGFDGEGGRIDIGSSYGLLDGGGFRFTKMGPGRLAIRVTNTVNLTELVVSNGLAYSENFDFNLGTNVTVYPGGFVGAYSPTGIRRTNNALITLEGGGLTGGGQSDAVTNVWTGPIQVNQPSTFHGGVINGNAHHFLLGEISGSKSITYLNNNSRRFDLFGTNDTFSGGWVVAGGGVLRAVDGGGLGTGAITNFGTVDFVKTNAGSLLGGVYGNGLLRHFNNFAEGPVTLGGVIQQANVQAFGGGSNTAAPLIFGPTAVARISGTLSTGNANTGGRINLDGATINAGNFFLGEQANQTGIVSHVNANVIVTNQVRIGHWPTEVSTYTMDGGSFRMTVDPTANPSGTGEQNGGFYIGIDGVGIFTQNSGDVTTAGLVLDNRSTSTLPPFTNTYTLNGGTLTLGRWGIQSPNTTYQINLGAGTVAASVSWTSALRMTLTSSATTIDPGANTISLNGPLSGSGGIVKEGTGGLLLNATNTFTSDLTVNNGTLGGNGSIGAFTLIDTGGTLSPGLSVGTLTVSNVLQLVGTTLMEVSRSGATVTSDRVRVFGGDLALAGPLIVTNVANALVGGEVFDLLDWDLTLSGTFSSVTLPTLAANLSWDTSQLYIDGTIRVTGTPSILTGPANVTAYVGDIARFNASVAGFGPFTNQWSKDGADIFGANGTNLALTNITLASAGTYTFCSSNEFGGNCASATLTVLEVTNIADGLIAWWTLDEFEAGNNRTLDGTTNLQHLAGFGIQASNVVSGVRSNAFNFNGAASNFVARIHSGEEALPAYQYPAASVAIWVKGSHTIQADRRVFIEASTNNNNPLYGFGTHTTQGGGPQVDIYVRNNDGSNPVNHLRGRLAAFDGNWHHITFVDNNGNISLYVDGQWDTNINYVRGSMTLNTVALAGVLRATYGVGFIGELDDAMVWRRALTSNEAAQVHANALGGAPVITQQPVAQAVECSSNATFSVVATSIDSIRYQWYFGAAPIAGATNASLSLTGALALAGNYSVVLTNFVGGVTSAVVALSVSDTIAPVVVAQDITLFLAGASVGITPADVFNAGGSSEACGSISLVSVVPNTFTCAGSYAVTLTAHDGNGNTNTAIATVTVVDPASTNLFSYEPFSCYSEGTILGQTYQGTGFGAGSWFSGGGSALVTNTSSLRYASGSYVLASEGGRAYTPAAGFNTAIADMNTSASGAFSNLVDGGLIGGANASGTLYFSFLARNASSSLDGSEDFAGLQLYDGAIEVLGIGNNWGAWAYSLFGISGDVDLTNNAGGFLSMNANVHLFVARIDYAAGGDDTVVVWMDPDISASEGSQGNLYRRTFTGNARFNRIALRSGSNNNDNSWDFDEIRFGSSWANVTASGIAITTQPASVAVQCGGNTSVSVVTASLVPPVYQWYRDGSAIPTATNTTLNLLGVTTNLAGSYTVVANNKYGSVTSVVATVTVTNTPTLISPAGPLAVGTENNECGSMVLAGGSTFRWELNDATGGAGTGWDLLNVTGDISIEATGGSPLTVNLWSLNGAAPGVAANWNNNTTNVFTIASASGSINGFAANKFTLNDANFSNDLAGGVFSIEEGSLRVKFTPNHAPIANSITNNRAPNVSFKLKIADLLAAATSDADGDSRGLVSLGASTNGATITTNDTYIFYSNPNNVEDEFTYIVRDFGPVYRAGDTVRTSTGTIRFTVNTPQGTNANAVAISPTNGVVGLRFAGIPGYAYEVQRTTDLTPPVTWTTLWTTNCPPLGLFDYIDLTPPLGQAYYRTAQP
jgi:autotransporter-associated beta strand protein